MGWTREGVAERLREAWDTLRRVPAHGVPGFVVSWPDFVQDVLDAYGYTSAIVRLARASPLAIDRMHGTFGWFRFLEGHAHLTKAMWLTSGCGMGPKRAGAILGIHRDTVRTRRDEALDRIAEGLTRAGGEGGVIFRTGRVDARRRWASRHSDFAVDLNSKCRAHLRFTLEAALGTRVFSVCCG